MLTELQGASHSQIAPQARASVPAPVFSTQATAVTRSTKDEHAVAIESATHQVPKVQLPKPVEIKVDIEKMKTSLKESLEKINQLMRDGGRNLSFSMDEKLGGLVIMVKNADTGEIVRQIPSDAVVRMAHNIDEFKGLLHNDFS